MNEKTWERRLFSDVKKHDGYAVKLLSSITGLPDRLVLMPGGRIWFVELKSPGKKLRLLQVVWRNRLEKLGFKYYVIDSKKSYLCFLNELASDI